MKTGITDPWMIWTSFELRPMTVVMVERHAVGCGELSNWNRWAIDLDIVGSWFIEARKTDELGPPMANATSELLGLDVTVYEHDQADLVPWPLRCYASRRCHCWTRAARSSRPTRRFKLILRSNSLYDTRGDIIFPSVCSMPTYHS